MNGERVGEWRRPAGGGQEFLYAESWLASAAARPLSLSLPLRPSKEPYRNKVAAFFENLLPDNRQILERIQRRFGVPSVNAFDLLSQIGRDCVGAVQLLPEDQPAPDVKHITSKKLSSEQIAELLSQTVGNPLAGGIDSDESFRISLAGAQEKTALLLRNGSWRLPTGSTPTTHILKLPLGVSPQGIDLSSSVENEWLCSEIVKGYGLPVAGCSIETFGEFKVLAVERFDRRLSSDRKWYMRLPQEDFCQACGIPPSLKYENDGGPGILKIMDMLIGSEQAEQDRRQFLRAQLIFWLLAAIDGHAKNFSIFILPGGSYRLTPFYDILSAHPVMGHGRGKLAPEKIRMAMAVHGKNRHYRWKEIQARHWIDTAKRCGVAEMPLILEDVIAITPRVIEQVQSRISKGFPDHIANSILDGLEAAVKQLKSNVAKV